MSDILPNNNYEVFDEDMEFRIKEISDFINASVPAGTGIITLLAKPAGGDNLSFFYMSNLPRSQMLQLLKSYMASEEAKELPPGETVL